MTTATRQEVLGLYRRIFRLARKWQAASGQMEDTIKEKQYILNEARTLFQKNKNVSVQLVSDSASSEDPMSQVTWVKPMRVFRNELFISLLETGLPRFGCFGISEVVSSTLANEKDSLQFKIKSGSFFNILLKEFLDSTCGSNWVT
ncbi:LYR motif-containing protein 1 isoform X2 [Camelus ferus]|uniref:LYR motif-containing protein 1 isoform X2 n=2 Tax=Camelus TaxID=9836 RepID=A0A8B8RHQ6_CAMFR|nr:LYR motif-containing protein 1 isoform X2 [Camelus dromedarius]XP_032316820.1 LYR motif-containing protein 1 isoform X2 [Camelus ferus]XP_045377138.1 LYR motif-containing protein 1 isoform X2 [Camelus bactrianus]